MSSIGLKLRNIINGRVIKNLGSWIYDRASNFDLKEYENILSIFHESKESNKLDIIIFIPFEQKYIDNMYFHMNNWSKEKAKDSLPLVANFLNSANIPEIRVYETENGIYIEPFWYDHSNVGKILWIFNCQLMSLLIQKNTNKVLTVEEIKKQLTYDDYKSYFGIIAIEEQQSIFLAETKEKNLARDIVMNSSNILSKEIKLSRINNFKELPYETFDLLKFGRKISYDEDPTDEEVLKYGNPMDALKRRNLI